MVVEQFFLDTAGLWTGLALAPFVLLYLIRPKPRHETIPSLLFVLKDMGKSNINSFLRTFFRDLLFLVQLLIILFLVAAAAKPYVNVPRTYLVEQTVVVLDASASMQAGDRWENAARIAEEELGSTTTLILAKGGPEILEERASPSKTRQALDGLAPTDTATDLSGALQLAGQYATTGTRVVVISDFLPTTGDLDYDTVAATLEAKGALVEYRPVTSPVENVGIIDLVVGPATSTVWVKNYNDRPEEVALSISDAERSFVLAKGETRAVEFNTPAGVAQIRINGDDMLAADDVAWTSTPEKTDLRVLIITNDRALVEESNFLLALDVIQDNFPTRFSIEYAEPPKIPALEHDVYVIHHANTDFLLPGTVSSIKEQVDAGKALLYFHQQGLFDVDWQGLIPVTPLNEDGGRASLIPETTTELTRDVEFGQASQYFRVTANEGSVVVAKTELDPIIVLQRMGRGTVLYYGLDDGQASFSQDPSYPVFWRRAMDLLTNRPSVANLNARTSTLLALPRLTRIETPTGSQVVELLALEHAGLYTLPDRVIAANLLSDAEGELVTPKDLARTPGEAGAEATEKAPQELTPVALWAAIVMLLLEILYVKYRGDF